MIWKTKITQITKTKYPLIMGAFGGWGKSAFASLFSEAGGLGIIAALNFPNFVDFREDLRHMKQLTDKPFGVNLSLPHSGFENIKKKTRTQDEYLKYVEIALDENVQFFTTSGYKATFIGQKVHEGGGYWFHKCVLIKHAIAAEKDGADAVTLVGLEGTGFKNPLTNSTLVNITFAKRMLKIPIIAAGGIGDSRGFLGALAMGADAVCLGTALMICQECPAPVDAKRKWIGIDVFSENFYKKIYHYNIKYFASPSTAIAHHRHILPLKSIIQDIMEDAELTLKSWGFNSNVYDSTLI
jgi:NAD(P)H-dependent flavin oxidoreductase YrpB (nitropropane dioxygenase family)